MTHADLYAFLKQHKLGVLGTVDADAMPQSALVGIAVTPDLEIVFDTVSSSRKYPNLKSTTSCSFVIGWSGAETVQYEGRAEELHNPELAPYQQLYFDAWPDGPERLGWPDLVYFVVRPVWIRYSDFIATPPNICEFTFK